MPCQLRPCPECGSHRIYIPYVAHGSHLLKLIEEEDGDYSDATYTELGNTLYDETWEEDCYITCEKCEHSYPYNTDKDPTP